MKSYPTRPIRLITPAPPGGSTDLLARLIGPRLAEALKGAIVIDNRGGAGGVVAAELTARAAPDGYTLLMAYSAHTTNVSLNPKANYRAVDDYQPITQVTSAPLVLVVNPQVMPVNSVEEMFAYGKANPAKMNFGSAGNGSGAHMAIELLKYMTGAKAQHIPYKGMGPAVIDLLGGQVPAMFAGIVPIQPQLRAGRVRAIAVTSARRAPALPQLPTIAESGVPGYEVTVWYGVCAPTATPQPILTKLNADIIKALNMPDLRQRLADNGVDAAPMSREEYAAFISSEMKKWAKVIKDAGIQPE
jgi:tripartite-type tricarboxylate transporter receptor subunit TctC